MIRTGPLPTGIVVVIWSVELSITVMASDNLVTTNNEGAKADEAKAQTMNCKGRKALLIIRSLLKPPDVNLDGVTSRFSLRRREL